MRATDFDLLDFWRTLWTRPLREACEWIGDDPPAGGSPLKNELAPWWVRPFFLQRWAIQAVVARKAWLKDHPGVQPERFGEDSTPRWGSITWTFAEPWCLRAMSEGGLLECWQWQMEQYFKIIEESPRMVGGGPWGQAALVACGHLAQYYRELKRRHGVARAREIVQAQLQQFVTWQPEAEQTAAPLQTITQASPRRSRPAKPPADRAAARGQRRRQPAAPQSAR